MKNETGINSKEYWDKRFGSGDWEEKKGRRQSEFFYRLAIKNFPDWFKAEIKDESMSICDLGCAEGEGVVVFGEVFDSSDITGSDISEEALIRARNYYPKYNFIQADINNIVGSYDVIFTSNTLEHFHNPDEVISNVLGHANKYFVMLLPFREFERIDEHFYTFDYKSFLLNNQGFNIVFYKEIDCTHLKNTQWTGEEILVIYQKSGSVGCKERTLEHMKNGNWDSLLERINNEKREERLFNEYIETISEKEKEIYRLKEKIEEDRNAIMQIQFEAAQHKQAELNSRETYIWKTGLRIEKILRNTGIAFIRSLLEISDFKRVGLWLTLRKGFNEALNRIDIRRSKEKNLKMCEQKFLKYKRTHDDAQYNDLTKMECPYEKDLVSIILPVLNGGDVLGYAIESILNQTYKNFEVIIINDGSIDNTAEIAEEYARHDNRITVVHQENKKIPHSLTKGFKMAKGEFLTWTSADNIMYPDCIEILVDNLKRKPDVGMVYGNMKLINAYGGVKHGHFWFEKPLFSGNVCLPHKADSLNTYANNTIGAAFMYRAKVGYILEDYSKYKHTLEDYDYWMRLNSLFKIEHIDEEKPIYKYRWHENSLTAHDRELGITRNRYKLMVLDDFRRDFYMSSLLWVVETENEQNKDYIDFISALKNAGHMILSRKQALKMELPPLVPNLCYIYFGNAFDIDVMGFGNRFSSKIIVSDKCDESLENLFDICITTNKKSPLKRIADYKGWFYIEDGKNIFSFTDSKVKNNILYKLEGMIESEPSYEKKFSVIICTYMRGEKLIDALWSMIRQSFSKKEYEILIVDNAPFTSGLKSEIEVFKQKYSDFEGFIRYIAVPQKGLSYARNAGMWNACGEYLLFIDDDVLADYYLLEELYSAFKYHPSVGVVGGQVILDVPFPRPEVLCSGWENLWSQFIVPDTTYKEATQQFEFPYGANFAARRSAIWRVGGFRMCYGRVGNDFAGGEEIALSFKMIQIGYSVGIQPRAKVLHRVDHDRFTKEHVKKTIRAGILTTYRFFQDLHTPIGWTEKYAKDQINITRKELKRFIRKDVEPIEILYKKCHLSAWQEMLKIIQDSNTSEG